jgi:hypothetical protein
VALAVLGGRTVISIKDFAGMEKILLIFEG